MKPRTLLASLSLVLASAHACADQQPQTSSETHFQCARDVDCPQGESCVARYCMHPGAPHDAGLHLVDTMKTRDASIGPVPSNLGSTPPVVDGRASMTSNLPTSDCTTLPPAQLMTDADRACDTLAAAACARMDVCMPGAWLFPDNYSLPHDVNLCRQRLTMACSAAMALSGSPTPAAVSECASRLPSFSCKEVYEAERYAAPFIGKRPLNHEAALELCGVRGSLPHDAACASDIQCAEGACSDYKVCVGAGCTQCTHCGPFLGIGDDCQPFDNRCPLGTFPYQEWYEPDGGIRRVTCQPLGNEGDPCPGEQAQQNSFTTIPARAELSDGCALGLVCKEGRCARALNEGDPCDPSGASGRECDAFRGDACIVDRCTRVREPPLNECPYVLDGRRCPILGSSGYCPMPCLYPASLGSTCSVGLNYDYLHCDRDR